MSINDIVWGLERILYDVSEYDRSFVVEAIRELKLLDELLATIKENEKLCDRHETSTD